MPSKSRDEFSKKTKTDLALRASYLCSNCKCPTVGPSDESSNAVTLIGVAAHICAAASGPGARRHDPSMTSEERSHIDNGIWLCAKCAILIDRDEKHFGVEVLRKMRRDHEQSRRLGSAQTHGEGDLVAIGSGIVAVGQLLGAGPSGIRLRLDHFVEGAGRDLLNFASDFDRHAPEGRYVLMTEIGYGGLLDGAPSVEREGAHYEMRFRLQESPPRRDAAADISTLCAETGQMIHGMDAFIQHFERTFGAARGTWFLEPRGGSHLSDLYWRYEGSPWFQRLVMLEMIRLASLPSSGARHRAHATPLACVNRINSVEVPSFELEAQELRMAVEFDLEGIGPWSGELDVFISTPEQLSQARAKAKLHHNRLRQIEVKN